MKTEKAVVDGKITNEALGLIQRRINEIVRRIEEGTIDFDWAINGMQKIIEGEKWLKSLNLFIPWREFKSGGSNKQELIKLLSHQMYFINPSVIQYIDNYGLKTQPVSKTVNLMRVRVGDIFTSYPTMAELISHIKMIGDFCSIEDALNFRLQFVDQPRGDNFWMIMEPKPEGTNEHSNLLFWRRHDGILYLSLIKSIMHKEHISLDQQIVFRMK